jgi:hypothetical protein
MENLTQIANQLKAQAKRTTPDPAQYTLASDLTLTVQYHPKTATWILSLTRLYHQATEEERRECREVFGVPEGLDFEVMYKKGWGVIRYCWSEAKQMHLWPVEKETKEFQEYWNTLTGR